MPKNTKAPGRRTKTGKPTVKKGYPKNSSQYADPQDKAYPLDTPAHIRAAASYFSKYKSRYSAAKQKQIAARISAAEKKHGIGKSKKG